MFEPIRAEFQRQVSIPGRFYGQPAYVPYLYDIYIEGAGGQVTDRDTLLFNVMDVDRAVFPELADYTKIELSTEEHAVRLLYKYEPDWLLEGVA